MHSFCWDASFFAPAPPVRYAAFVSRVRFHHTLSHCRFAGGAAFWTAYLLASLVAATAITATLPHNTSSLDWVGGRNLATYGPVSASSPAVLT